MTSIIFVMVGLDPTIQAVVMLGVVATALRIFFAAYQTLKLDGRVKPGHDDWGEVAPLSPRREGSKFAD